MTRDFKKAGKIEKKLKLALGGYQSRAAAARDQIVRTLQETEQATLELNAFEKLRTSEQAAITEVSLHGVQMVPVRRVAVVVWVLSRPWGGSGR